ncbi:MAG: FAD-binding oxidoreductase [Candidatus Aminicenantes bacterium]|nr:FAD-binding oxidoreductase [Candidatus Aminicenantes bacterium]
MDKNYDVVLIGAGIIGCCIAFELSKKGYKTLNIDKEATAGAGSTANSCGNVRFYYSTRDGVALAYESAWYWHNWRQHIDTEDERGLAKFSNTGSVFVKSDVVDWPRVKRNFDAVGVKYENWDLKKLQKMVPVCDFHSFSPPRRPDDPKFFDKSAEWLEGACFTPESGYVGDPLLATQNMEAATKAKGGRFLYNRKVTEIRRSNNRVLGVTLDDGTRIDAPVVVNVSGPHSFLVTEMAGQTENNAIKTRALRHEVHVVPPCPGYKPEEEGFHTNDADIGAYYRPETGNMILTGSVDPECDPKEWVDPDNFNRQVSTAQWNAQVYRLARRFPDLPIPSKPKGIVDLYDVSDDWLPVYDRSDLNGYYQAIGTSGNQFKTAPVVGALMAELIDRVEKGFDHDAHPLQYRLPHLDIEIDTGVFHRKRQINPNSTFSVIG